MKPKRIKLLFVAEEFAVNGAMMSLLALLKALPTDKYDISLFLFEHGGELMKQLPDYVHVLPEKVAYSVHRLPTKLAVKKTIKQGRFDLILYRILLSIQRRLELDYKLWWWMPEVEGDYDVVCTYNDGFVAPMIIRKVKSGKKVCWIHFPYTHAPLMKYEYEALKTTDACVTVSHQVGRDLDKALGCKSAPQYVVHNIIDAESCKRRAEEPCEEPRREGVYRIVSVGRVTPAKGFDIICPTAQLLADKGFKYEWYIIGEGEDRQRFMSQVVKMNLQDNVHFIGNKYNPMPWVKSADVVVQPSTFESWGMTISEALCLGRPVVASNLQVFTEQIQNGVNGLMKENTPSILAGAIEEVLTNWELRQTLESNASKYPFTKETVLKEFDILIKNVINEK